MVKELIWSGDKKILADWLETMCRIFHITVEDVELIKDGNRFVVRAAVSEDNDG